MTTKGRRNFRITVSLPIQKCANKLKLIRKEKNLKVRGFVPALVYIEPSMLPFMLPYVLQSYSN